MRTLPTLMLLLLTGAGISTFSFLVARSYAASYGRFTSVDPLAEKTPWLSPYAYCANNPVNCIDPDGKDICVLLDDGVPGHIALLIQDELSRWEYFSVNGNNIYISGSFFCGRKFNDVRVGSWKSPEEFMQSPYNEDGGEDYQDDPSRNYFSYERGYKIKSTPEQDAIMRKNFIETADTKYDLLGNNCAHAVQKSMFEAGLPVASPKYVLELVLFNQFNMSSGLFRWVPNFNEVPAVTFVSIIMLNPGGKYIKK